MDEDPEKIIPISLDELWKHPGFRVMRGVKGGKPGWARGLLLQHPKATPGFGPPDTGGGIQGRLGGIRPTGNR